MKNLKKIDLSQIPTPIQICHFENKKFLIKRDDLTGCELSGNKVRKLEYLLYDAKKNKADIIFTCGGIQSNHARATTIAAKKIKLPTKLFLWGSEKTKLTGNLFFNKVNNAEIRFLNKSEYKNVNDLMLEESILMKKKGLNVYIIPEGGSNIIGIYAYFNFVSELSNQLGLKKLEGIVLPAGSGGTAAGILAGLSYYGFDIKLYVVNVLYDELTIRKKIINLAQAFILQHKIKIDLMVNNLIVLSGYSNEGYKKISQDKIKLMIRFANESGILFDPVYTGKTFFAYYKNFLINNLGMKNLFVHTGGLFGIFGREKEFINNL
jgi:D-cysteine desulfhydrase